LHGIDWPGLDQWQPNARQDLIAMPRQCGIQVIDDPLDNLIDTNTICPCDPQRRRLQVRGRRAQEGRC
jgi:hypothetical protein